ncbi:MAG: hypothetical protein ACK55I_10330, partial [bacterium]
MCLSHPDSTTMIETHGDRLMHQRFTGRQLHAEAGRHSHLLRRSFRGKPFGHGFGALWLSCLEFFMRHGFGCVQNDTGTNHAT